MAILQRVNLIPQERIDLPDLTNDQVEYLICDFLQALSNMQFFNTWTWETYPEWLPIEVTPYNPDVDLSSLVDRLDQITS